MKTNLTFLLVLCFCSLQSKSQILNAGFEDWTNFGTYSDPDHWFSNNFITQGSGVITCEEGTPGNPGAKYLKLTSKDVPGIGVISSSITSGEFNNLSGEYVPGLPFNQRPTSFTGSWQYMPASGDGGAMFVMLTRWNPGLQAQDLIGIAATNWSSSEPSWVNFDIPFNYSLTGNPDSATIYFTASSGGVGGPVDGSYVYVDNLAFSGIGTGITNGAIPTITELFPNPARQFVYVSQTNPAKETKYEITTIDGKLVQTGTITGIKAKIEFNDLKPGAYFVILINEGVKTTKRIVVSE